MIWIENIKETKHPAYLEAKQIFMNDVEPTGNFSVDMAYNILSYTLAKGYIIYDQANVIKSRNGEIQHDNMYFNIFISENFKKHKQVYVLNNVLFERLKATSGVKDIESDIIDKLPYPTFWLDMTNCRISVMANEVEGCFICHCHTEYHHPLFEGANVENSLAMVLKVNRGLRYELIPIVIELKKIKSTKTSISDAISQQWDEHEWIERNEEYKEYIQIFQDVLQVIYYMCTVKPDITTRPAHKPNKPGKKKVPKRKEPTINQLGYRIGETLGKSVVRYIDDNTATEDTEKSGAKKSPHFRKAHWQTVWTGKGRETKELRWINLVYVNGVEKEVSESDIVTLHNMI